MMHVTVVRKEKKFKQKMVKKIVMKELNETDMSYADISLPALIFLQLQ